LSQDHLLPLQLSERILSLKTNHCCLLSFTQNSERFVLFLPQLSLTQQLVSCQRAACMRTQSIWKTPSKSMATM